MTKIISVVIVTKGERRDDLLNCLKSLAKQSFKDFEVIIVAPLSMNLHVENALRLNMRIIRQDGVGICNARNCGVKASEGDIIAFTDDDACVDSVTQILTKNGWKTHNQIRLGEDVATLNLETQKLEYQPVLRIISKKHNGEMVHVQTRSLDMLVTPDHRVLCLNHKRGNGSYKGKVYRGLKYNTWEYKYLLAGKLPIDIKILAGAIYDGKKADVSDDVIRLLAWVITEGTLSKRYNDISIGQSEKNFENVERIKKIIENVNHELVKLGQNGPYGGEIIKREGRLLLVSRRKKIHELKGYSLTIQPPRPPRVPNRTYIFRLAKPIRDFILQITDGNIKRIPRWLLSSSQNQMEMFYEELILGDGNRRKYLTRVSQRSKTSRAALYPGLDKELADDYQELCLKLNIRATISKVKKCYAVYTAETCNSHHVAFRTRIKTVKYYGSIWCVTTNNNNFVARRNGKVFITGNCPYSNWLEKIDKHFKANPELDYLGGEFTLEPENIWQRWVNKRYHLSEKNIEAGLCHGNNMAYRRTVFDKELFDEGILFGGDESEFQRCLQGSGMQGTTFQDILVRHQHRNSFWSFTKMRWKYAEGKQYIYEEKYGRELFHWKDILNVVFFLSFFYAILLFLVTPWLWAVPILVFLVIFLHERKNDSTIELWIVDVYVAILWTLSKMFYSLRWHFRRWGWI